MGLFKSLKSIDEEAFISSNPLFNISIEDAQLLKRIVDNLGFPKTELFIMNLTLREYLRRGANPLIPVQVEFKFEDDIHPRNVAVHAFQFQEGIWTGYRSLYMDLHPDSNDNDIVQSVFNQIPQMNQVFGDLVEKTALKGII